jgi:hypothetical protein
MGGVQDGRVDTGSGAAFVVVAVHLIRTRESAGPQPFGQGGS